MSTHLVRPGEGEPFLSLASHVSIKVPSEATGGAFSVMEHVVPPQGGPPPHTHRETELIYIVEGTFSVVVGTEQGTVGGGTLLHVPPGVVHTTRNVGERAGRQLNVYLPGGGEGFFREIGTPVDDSHPVPDLDQPSSLAGVDMARVLDLAAHYGMQVVPPAS
jgi:mannose-6-phosphate isomerase-like protein (cupin superfamily)